MKHLLVLAGTIEARLLLAELSNDERFRLTASLAGVTSSPFDLTVPTRSGGFGGLDGLRSWVKANDVDAIIDITHPYAAVMSQRAAAMSGDVPVIAFNRPEWRPDADDNWTDFASWTAMAEALPRDARPFLAGGSRAVQPFLMRDDLMFLGRGLKFNEDVKKHNNLKLIESLPNKSHKEELALLTANDITHICAKNSGGAASDAKLTAARQLGLPVWMLARPHVTTSRLENGGNYQSFKTLDAVRLAVAKLGA